MACTTTSSSFTVSAADVTWGKREKFCLSLDAATITGGEHFLISSSTTDYYVWFDLNDGSVDPAVAGRTAIEVDITATDSDTIGAALKPALEASEFYGDYTSADECFCVESKEVGAPKTAWADGDTGWTFDQQRNGIGGSLGATEGGVEVTFEISTLDVLTDQTGETLRDKIITGTKASVSMSLSEMTEDRWGLIVGETTGDRFTPSSGTELIGYGESRIYKSLFDLSGELVLHPTKNEASDKSEDLTFWLTAPIPESYNFSGTETSKMSVSFEALVDRSKNTNISIFAYGDGSQDARA